jgi:hypothetical protein
VIAAAVVAGLLPAQASAKRPHVRIELWFAHSHGTQLSAPQAMQPVVGGRLVIGGRVHAGTVTIVQRPLGLPAQSLGEAQATRNGLFSYRLPPGGTRDVYATAGAVTSNVVHEHRSAWINFTVQPRRIKAGQQVRFAGSAPETAGVSLLVELQVRLGRDYQTFDLLHTDMAGNFRGSYRLTTPGARFLFRARIRAQNGFLLAPSTSGSVGVRVR